MNAPAAPAQQTPPSPLHPLHPLHERRAELARRLHAAGGGVAIVMTAPEVTRSRDTEHPFRADSHFHYLTGFDEPEAVLVLRADGHSELFCREKHPEQEVWTGVRLGPDAARETLGVAAAYPLSQLDRRLPELLNQAPAVWTVFGSGDEPLDQRLDGWLAEVRAQSHFGHAPPSTHRDLGVLLDEMRLFKRDDELALMRRAAGISAGAHRRAMRFCAARFRADPAGSVAEYEIEAELLHEFRRHGAAGPAYPSIVAAGRNACVLHHSAGAARLRADELCLIDAGCEFDGYASDVTRTFPASGRYSAPQRELYDIVVAAQEAAVAATRPGLRHRDAHHAAVRVLAQGMLDTGLLSPDRHGSLDDVIEKAHYRQFFMHGTGHWLGRDVHDTGDYLARDEAPFEQPDYLGGRVVKHPSRKLEPGMVVTLEPGLYVRPAEGVPERYWHIGIRIEDDAVLTAHGCELISRGVPVQADEIEALMRSELP
ncbi:aminopeptidase P N-terminal domain-containing protein [Rhizobacter sp. J219]|uniref:aminopeptidase P N-terminal domain-containing protein n=1 Tax=Rhizobacter sp. J219 TaxID=2898430 RepID=UPI0021516276|nr:aminopeptidase P N-terminal domain-containing protein [Rhizobacter sp. J219]MCR5885026.1 aminopeptidase P N-terminal domain-containing protein [Rhizobacter sp. J219]